MALRTTEEAGLMNEAQTQMIPQLGQNGLSLEGAH